MFQRPFKADQPSDQAVVAGVRLPGVGGADDSVQGLFRPIRKLGHTGNLQAGGAKPARADRDQQRFRSQFAAPQRVDTRRHQLRTGQTFRHFGHRTMASAADASAPTGIRHFHHRAMASAADRTRARNTAGSIAG